MKGTIKMYESIIKKINEQNWLEATRELSAILSENKLDEQLAILAATVLTATNNIESARKVITEGLKLNSANHELWLVLGQTYEAFNINQAYLCYENALFYCNSNEDAEVINSFLDNIRSCNDFCVNKCAIVVLSYNALQYTKECIESIRSTCPQSAYELIVIDNASGDGSVQWLKEQQDIILQCNEENVGFPAGCNQGIGLAQKHSDIFLLNNDTVLPPNALFWLRMGLYENDDVGAVGSVSNYVSNFQQVQWNCRTKDEFLNIAARNNLPMEKPYEKRLYLVGFAMLIRREALEEAGYFDEIFTPGTYEDEDMGFKLCEKGYDVVLCLNSFIYHYGSGGGSNTQKWNNLYARNAAKLADKWGFDPNKYVVVWQDAVDSIRADEKSPLKALEVGCGLGLTLMSLKNRFPNAEVHGIEGNRNLWPLTPKYLDVHHCGPETDKLPWQKNYFDLILIFDVLNNGFDQVALVHKYAEYLNESGILITSWGVLKKSDIISAEANKEKMPGIAMCMFTHNHPETVEQVLAATCLNYYFHGVDVYYYDSSDDDATEKLVREWINRGYTNLYYVNVKGLQLRDKWIAVSRGEGLAKHYDYIWPSKDRTIWPKETLDAVREHIAEYPDIMYLEVRGNDSEPEKSVYGDGIMLYRRHSLGLTSIDTSIYKYDSVFSDTAEYQNVFEKVSGFIHWYLILKKLAEMEKPKCCILQGKRITLYDVKTESMWADRPFYVWKDCWINANEQLPNCYAPYRDQVIKYVASQPWLLGGIERLKELKAAGALTVEKLGEIEKDWERVSDIPFEVVRRIAEE